MTETRTSVLSVKQPRRRRIKGGTNLCPWCDQARVRGSSFCLEHKREYSRDWHRERTKELKKYRAMFAATTCTSSKIEP